MGEQHGTTPLEYRAPSALFVGDFNVGKSSIINALLRRDALFVSREESRALPTLVARTRHPEAGFAALHRDGARFDDKGHDEFLVIRQDKNNDAGYVALAARFPATPFGNLVLVDTAGASSDSCATFDFTGLPGREHTMLILVTDIEYWAAKHTMDVIASHLPVYGERLIIVANKADHLNVGEIRRICDKAPDRMKTYGIAPAPRFFAVSARLESARRASQNEYRHRTKRDVRELCDAGFDALRVALYEFETDHGPANGAAGFQQVFESPLVSTLLRGRGSDGA